MSETAIVKSRKLAFIGTPELSVPFLNALCLAGHEILIVVTGEDRRRGRREEPSPSPVKKAANELDLPVIHDLEKLKDYEVDLAVVVAFGSFIPLVLLERIPMINVHFSLLPRWRGPAPIERAILAGDTKSGVCVMEVGEEFDVGRVFAQQEVAIYSSDTSDDLRNRLVESGCQLLVSTLSKDLDEPIEQKGEIVWAEKLTSEDRKLDWAKEAEELDRMIRVGGAWTTLEKQRFKIWKAEPNLEEMSVASGKLVGDLVSTGKGSLKLLEVQSENRARQSFETWKRGAHLKANVGFGDE